MKIVGLVLLIAGCGEANLGSSTSALRQNECDELPTGIDRFDDYLDFIVPDGLMPDNRLAGQPARLQVHRVRPLYAHGKCHDVHTKAVILIAGRSLPAGATFDLRHKSDAPVSLSIQEDLARAGVETFAPNLLGYGQSSRFYLDDPGNASLPPYNADGTCSSPAGCDRSHNSLNGYDQQKALMPNPLAVRRPHSSKNLFARTDTWVRDIRQVIDYAISAAHPHDGKVVLVGYSAGAQRVGRALYPTPDFPDNQTAVVDKVSKVAFISPLVLGPAEEPQVETTFPLVLSNNVTSGYTLSPNDARCTGHVVPNSTQEMLTQVLEEDAFPDGKLTGWGTNHFRFPSFNGYGFNDETAPLIDLPTMVMWGLQDNALRSGKIEPCSLFDGIAANHKVMVQIDCASHQVITEGCSGDRCQPGDTPAYGTEPGTPWAGPHSTVVAALLEWIEDTKFAGKHHGSFTVDASGVAQPGRTCPWL